MTMVILACALPSYGVWWPFFVIVFYLLAPLPTLIVRRSNVGTTSSSQMEWAIFITMGIIVSSFALPIVLARTPDPTIKWGACYLTLAGNVIIYTTLIGFFVTFEDSYSTW